MVMNKKVAAVAALKRIKPFLLLSASSAGSYNLGRVLLFYVENIFQGNYL